MIFISLFEKKIKENTSKIELNLVYCTEDDMETETLYSMFFIP